MVDPMCRHSKTSTDQLSEDPPAAANISTITAATIVPYIVHKQLFQRLARSAAASKPRDTMFDR